MDGPLDHSIRMYQVLVLALHSRHRRMRAIPLRRRVRDVCLFFPCLRAPCIASRWGKPTAPFFVTPNLFFVLRSCPFLFHSIKYQVGVAMGVFYFLLLVAVGTVVFKMSGHMSVIDALYLTVVSSSTVGYGKRRGSWRAPSVEVYSRLTGVVLHTRRLPSMILYTVELPAKNRRWSGLRVCAARVRRDSGFCEPRVWPTSHQCSRAPCNAGFGCADIPIVPRWSRAFLSWLVRPTYLGGIYTYNSYTG